MIDTGIEVTEVTFTSTPCIISRRMMMDAWRISRPRTPIHRRAVRRSPPILGCPFDGCAESGYLAKSFGDFTPDMYARSTARRP